MNILVTGANGFIGQALCKRMLADGYPVRGAVRGSTQMSTLPTGVEGMMVGNVGPDTDWSEKLDNIECVVHLAARVHIMHEDSVDPLAVFRQVNVVGTERLARQAAEAGVKRFIFVSSIGVNGNNNQKPFTELDMFSPQEAYAQSKYEAEIELVKLSKDSNMEFVIIRPPLVYGSDAPGNFGSLLRWVGKGVPLPLGAVNNKRSLVALDNLVDFIITCINHPAAANQLFLISDNEDVSTTELLRKVASALAKKPRLLPVPVWLMTWLAKLIGMGRMANSLFGSLQVDSSKARKLLGWRPVISMDEQLQKTDSAFIKNRRNKKPSLQNLIIRFFDLLFSLAGMVVTLPFLVIITLIGLFDTGSPVFRQKRVGRHKRPFVLLKFRTMKLDSPSVASHLASASSITPFGHFLRRTKLDEIPQLLNVLKGEMSLVGPRPCLFNQHELIEERDRCGVFDVRPGITGLAQINEIDMSTQHLLAETDARMIRELTVGKYFFFTVQTLLGKGSGDRVKIDDKPDK